MKRIGHSQLRHLTHYWPTPSLFANHQPAASRSCWHWIAVLSEPDNPFNKEFIWTSRWEYAVCFGYILFAKEATISLLVEAEAVWYTMHFCPFSIYYSVVEVWLICTDNFCSQILHCGRQKTYSWTISTHLMVWWIVEIYICMLSLHSHLWMHFLYFTIDNHSIYILYCCLAYL